MSIELIHELEELAANAWPAAVAQVVDGWRLRGNHGATRRANSVLANECGGRLGLEERLGLVEEFYARRRAPARFQICPASLPAGLDERLATRGYAAGDRTCVQ